MNGVVLCRSWRPTAQSTMSGDTKPGGKARAWVPCRNKVPSGVTRCDTCIRAMLTHPHPSVRLELAKDPSTPVEVVEVLAGDMDIAVATPASQILLARTRQGA